MRSLSVELRLAAAVVTICVVAAAAGAATAAGVFRSNVEAASLARLRDAADAYAAQERSDVEKLAATLDALLANQELRDAFVARDRERLLAIAAPLFETMRRRDGITHWYFIDPDPPHAVVLRVHRPELHGDPVGRATFRRAVETGELGAGKELGQTAFALRAVRPWLRDGKLVGYVELAEEIDHFLAALKARTGDEYGLLVKKKFLDEQAWARVLGPRSNTWNDRPEVVVVDTTTFTQGIIDYDGDVEAIPERGGALGTLERSGRVFARGIFPVSDAAGRKVGGLFVLHDVTGLTAAMRAGLVQTYLVLLAIGIASAGAVAAAIRWLVFARLGRLRRELEARADASGLPPGRYVELESDDELGRLGALLRRVLFPSRARGDPEAAAPERAAPGSAAERR